MTPRALRVTDRVIPGDRSLNLRVPRVTDYLRLGPTRAHAKRDLEKIGHLEHRVTGGDRLFELSGDGAHAHPRKASNQTSRQSVTRGTRRAER